MENKEPYWKKYNRSRRYDAVGGLLFLLTLMLFATGTTQSIILGMILLLVTVLFILKTFKEYKKGEMKP